MTDESRQNKEEKDRIKVEEDRKRKQEEEAYLEAVKAEMIDDDLFEKIPNEEMKAILDHERKQAKHLKTDKKRGIKKPYVIIAFLLAGFMLIHGLAILSQTFSLPVVDFLITSARLSGETEVADLKETVVVVDTTDGRGTGFFVSETGGIITNAHVVNDAEEVTIGTKNEGLFVGHVTHRDASLDLAYIEVEGHDFPYLQLSETPAEVGDLIRFVGNPLMFNRIANEGEVISTSGRALLETDVVLIDAPVYRGNSGSPVVNEANEVISVIFATRSHEEFNRVGLAVPVEALTQFLEVATAE